MPEAAPVAAEPFSIPVDAALRFCLPRKRRATIGNRVEKALRRLCSIPMSLSGWRRDGFGGSERGGAIRERRGGKSGRLQMRLAAESLESRHVLAYAVGMTPTAPPANAILFLDGAEAWTRSTLLADAPAVPRLLPRMSVTPPGAALGTPPCVGDYSGDGLDDLAWRSADGRMWVSVFSPQSGFSGPQRWGQLPAQIPWDSARSGDFNADGRVDLLVRNPTTGNWRLLASTGGSFAASTVAGTWPTNVAWTDIVQGDFDGDGGADVAGRDSATGAWTVSRGTPTGFETHVWGRMNATIPWQGVRAADFDGDGRADIIARNPVNGNWRLWTSDGSSLRLGEIRATWAAGTVWTDITVGDFDADRRADIAARDPASGQWTVSRGSSAAFTTSVFGGLPAATTWKGFVAGDFNGDGRTDLAAQNVVNGNWRMLPSTGAAFGQSQVIGSTPVGGDRASPRPLRLAYERLNAGFDTAKPGLLADLSPYKAPRDFTTAGTRVFFVAETQTSRLVPDFSGGQSIIGRGVGRELCVTDGTAAGTRLVRDIRPDGSSNISSLTAVGDRVFFVATDGPAGYQIWTSDGTEAGTFPIMDRRFGENSRPDSLTAVGGTLFFVAPDPVDLSYELWKSDGTRSGTSFVKDVWPQSWKSRIGNLLNVDGTLMFTAFDPAIDGGRTPTIWSSDGTAVGTIRIGQFPSGVEGVSQLTAAGGKLFAAASNLAARDELWVLDAGARMARMVLDIHAIGGSSISSLTPLGNVVLFSANDGITGDELWRSDGTAAGTRLVLDIQPTYYNQQYWTPPVRTTAPIAGMIFLPPNDPNWMSGSRPADFVVFNGRLAFTAFDTIHGRQVWTSDGTAAGTWRVSDIDPMPAWWGLDSWISLAAVGRQLYFSRASLPVSQWPLLSPWAVVPSFKSLWRTDGSPDSAVKIAGAEVNSDWISWVGLTGQGYSSESRKVLAAVGSSLIFSGSDAGLNNEPWKLDPADKTSRIS